MRNINKNGGKRKEPDNKFLHQEFTIWLLGSIVIIVCSLQYLQYPGKFINTVSSLMRIILGFPHLGHLNHLYVCFKIPPLAILYSTFLYVSILLLQIVFYYLYYTNYFSLELKSIINVFHLLLYFFKISSNLSPNIIAISRGLSDV